MKELNIISKFLTIILLGIALYFCNNSILIYLIAIILITCLFNIRKFDVGILVVLVILGKMFSLDIDNIDRVYYLILMMGIITLVLNSLTILERQYIFDKTIYKWKDMKVIRKHLYNCYYDKCFSENIKSMNKYSFDTNNKHLIRTKTNNDLNDIYILSRLRFYGIYDRKRVLFPDKWERLDTLYLFIIIIIFLVIIYFR